MSDFKQNAIGNSSSNTNDINNFINNYLKKHWKWFILSIIAFVALAYFYLRYTAPEYAISAKIMLINDKPTAPETIVFDDLREYSEKSTKVDDEIEILKSRSLMVNVVKELSLNYRFFAEGRIHKQELYPEPPIKVNFFKSDSIIQDSGFIFHVNILSDTKFGYHIEGDETNQEFSFGTNIPTPMGNMVITPNTVDIKKLKGRSIMVSIDPIEKIAQFYKDKIVISPTQEGSNVLTISLEDQVVEKAINIIDELIKQYNNKSIEDKALIAKRTSDFINERIDLIASDLSQVDSSAVKFKAGNRLTNIASDANIYVAAGSENEQQLIAAGTELNMANYMKDFVTNQEASELIPANIGLTDPTISETTTRYNELVLERERLLKSSSEKNPIVVNLDQQLSGLKQTLSQSLNNLTNTLSIKVNNLKNREARINSRIYSVPGQERKFRDIERQQQIKESLYLYLLEKREESVLSLASKSANARIIDPAYLTSEFPVSPKKKIIYLAGLIFGLLVPFSIIYLKNLLDNKVHSKEDVVKAVSNVPFLAEIPKINNSKKAFIKRNDRSVLAESFRILYTNLDYFINSKKVSNDKGTVIYVTSTIGGEGKSFVAENLALTLAYSNKKVLLLGADIRNPSFRGVLNDKKINKFNGLTEYLTGKKEINEIIQPILDEGKLDVITSGTIPPNPAEILMNNKMKLLFEELKKHYDFIVADTAPSMLVTDTLLISNFADHTIYVAKAGYTDKKILDFPQEIQNGEKLKGMVMVVNGVKNTNFGYGNKYGKAYKAKTPKKIKS